MLTKRATLIEKAIVISEEPPEAVPLVSHVFVRENAEAFLRDAVR